MCGCMDNFMVHMYDNMTFMKCKWNTFTIVLAKQGHGQVSFKGVIWRLLR